MSEQITESRLPEGWQRFLSEVHVHSLKTCVREGTDFVNVSGKTATFSCAVIMASLDPDLRAKILEPCTNMHPKIAFKMDAAHAAVSLQIALDELVCLPENALENFDPDDRVLNLDTQSLWSFETGSEYWVETNVEAETTRNREHMRFVLEVGLKTGLLTPTHVIVGVGYKALLEHLPDELLDRAINAVRDANPKTREEHDAVWLGVVTPEELVKYVPLDHIYAGVIVPMAERNEFVDKPEPAAVSNTEPSPEVTVNSESDEDVDVALDSLAAPPKTEDESPKA